jgi:voltage-gated sodium channel
MLGSDKAPFEQIGSNFAEPSASPFVAAVYFISFFGLGTMIMLNLFIGVIINSMNEAQKDILKEQLGRGFEPKSSLEKLEQEVSQLESQVLKIKELITKGKNKSN